MLDDHEPDDREPIVPSMRGVVASSEDEDEEAEADQEARLESVCRPDSADGVIATAEVEEPDGR